MTLYCVDDFKLMFKSNKCIVLKNGAFVGKAYDSEGVLRFSLNNASNNIVNNVSKYDESNVFAFATLTY